MDLIRIFHWASSSPLSSFVHHAVCSKRFKIRCSRKTVCTNISKTFLSFLSFVLSFFPFFVVVVVVVVVIVVIVAIRRLIKNPSLHWT